MLEDLCAKYSFTGDSLTPETKCCEDDRSAFTKFCHFLRDQWVSIKRLPSFVGKILSYAWFLRNDYDWDWTFILKLMEFKMRRHADYFEKHGVSKNRKKKAKKMRLCAALLKRLHEGKYDDARWARHMPTIENGNDKLASTLLTETVEYYEYMESQDLEMFCKIFTKHIFYWWD